MNGIRIFEPINALLPQIESYLSFGDLQNITMSCKDSYYIDGTNSYQKARRIYRKNKKIIARQIDLKHQKSVLFNCIVSEMIDSDTIDEVLLTFSLKHLYMGKRFSYQTEILNMCLNRGTKEMCIFALLTIQPKRQSAISCRNCKTLFMSRNFGRDIGISSNDGLCEKCNDIFRFRRLVKLGTVSDSSDTITYEWRLLC